MIFSISAKIQDGSQNLVPKINAFLHFTQKFQMAAKNGSRAIFVKCRQYTLQIPSGLNISSKSLYLERFQDKCDFAFYAEIQDGCQKWRESDFCFKSPVGSARQKFRRNHSISNGFPDKCVLCHQYTLQIPCWSKILSKSLNLALFLR